MSYQHRTNVELAVAQHEAGGQKDPYDGCTGYGRCRHDLHPGALVSEILSGEDGPHSDYIGERVSETIWRQLHGQP